MKVLEKPSLVVTKGMEQIVIKEVAQILDANPHATATQVAQQITEAHKVDDEFGLRELAVRKYQDIIIRFRKRNLTEVYETFQKWLHLEDLELIDLCLAVALSQRMKGDPIWLIVVQPSGSGKSVHLMSFVDENTTKVMHRLTPRTLVTGKKGEDDLILELRDKLVLIPDFAEILKMHPHDKALLFAQLRELYDGRAGLQTGSGVDKEYSGIRVTMLCASTPTIDSQILIHQDLGTRELIWRSREKTDRNRNMIMEKAWENQDNKQEMVQELNFTVKGFLRKIEIKDIEISDKVKDKIKGLMEYLRVMRAVPELDSASGELRNMVYPEEPTRALKQLKTLFICLKNLDPHYSDERALRILNHVVESSVIPVRAKILEMLVKSGKEMSTSEVAKTLRIGYRTAYANLNTLWNLKVVDMTEIIDPSTTWRKTTRMWKADQKNKVVRALKGVEYKEKELGVYIPSTP